VPRMTSMTWKAAGTYAVDVGEPVTGGAGPHAGNDRLLFGDVTFAPTVPLTTSIEIFSEQLHAVRAIDHAIGCRRLACGQLGRAGSRNCPHDMGMARGPRRRRHWLCLNSPGSIERHRVVVGVVG
jgi:hypothetical protein